MLVEMVLLIATLLHLRSVEREWRERERLMEYLVRTTSVLTRQDYFMTVMESLTEAEKEIIGGITGTKPAGGDETVVNRIAELIEEASSRGVRIRYLIPKARDRLYVGYLYSRAGAEVRYHKGFVAYDLRYMVVDDSVVILGVPDERGEDKPTRRGFRVRSESLSLILKDRFDSFWNSEDAIPYEEYAKRSIEHLRKMNPGISDELISKHLGIDVEEVRRLSGAPKKMEGGLIS